MSHHPNRNARLILIDPPRDLDIGPLLAQFEVRDPSLVDVVVFSADQPDLEAEVLRLCRQTFAETPHGSEVTIWGSAVQRGPDRGIHLNGRPTQLLSLLHSYVSADWNERSVVLRYLGPTAQISAGHNGVIAFDEANDRFNGQVELSNTSGFQLVNPNNGNVIGHMVRAANVGSNDNGFPNHTESWEWTGTTWPPVFRLRNPPGALRLRTAVGTWEKVDLSPFPGAATGDPIESGGAWSWWKITHDDGTTQTPVGYLQRNDSTGKQRWYGKAAALHQDSNSKRWLKMTDEDDSLLFESIGSLTAAPSGHVDVTTALHSS